MKEMSWEKESPISIRRRMEAGETQHLLDKGMSPIFWEKSGIGWPVIVIAASLRGGRKLSRRCSTRGRIRLLRRAEERRRYWRRLEKKRRKPWLFC